MKNRPISQGRFFLLRGVSGYMSRFLSSRFFSLLWKRRFHCTSLAVVLFAYRRNLGMKAYFAAKLSQKACKKSIPLCFEQLAFYGII
jgi:hypothetical protein